MHHRRFAGRSVYHLVEIVSRYLHPEMVNGACSQWKMHNQICLQYNDKQTNQCGDCSAGLNSYAHESLLLYNVHLHLHLHLHILVQQGVYVRVKNSVTKGISNSAQRQWSTWAWSPAESKNCAAIFVVVGCNVNWTDFSCESTT